MKHDLGTECCLSLCQAVSFLPAAEEDEEMMMRKDDGHGRGTHMFNIIVLIMNHLCHYKQLYLDTRQMVLKLHDNYNFSVFSLKVTVFVSFLSLSQVKVVTAERRLSVFSLSQTLSALSALGQCARILALINNASLPVPCLLQSHITG